jgi:hypothetical protein
MQSTISQSETKLKNAVQFLGKKEDRYFACGFKKIICNLENFSYSLNKLTSLLHVKWGDSWSIKDTCEIKPHLGSIEGFTVAARMIETFMAIKYDMCEDDISNSKFKKINIKTKLCSSDFNAPFSVCLVEKDAKIDRIVKSSSEFEISVGNFQFNVCLEFVVRSSTSGISFNNFATTTISSMNNYYYEGYKLSNIDIKNILIKNGKKTLTATPDIKRSSDKLHGLATNLLPELTFVDFLRIGGQLAQILLYSFDGLKRKDTQNLWIRSLCAEFNEQNIKHDEISKVNLADVKKVALNNETWRTAIINLEIGSIQATAKVGHILKNNINE